jgi:hypothetical protein
MGTPKQNQNPPAGTRAPARREDAPATFAKHPLGMPDNKVSETKEGWFAQ